MGSCAPLLPAKAERLFGDYFPFGLCRVKIFKLTLCVEEIAKGVKLNAITLTLTDRLRRSILALLPDLMGQLKLTIFVDTLNGFKDFVGKIRGR